MWNEDKIIRKIPACSDKVMLTIMTKCAWKGLKEGGNVQKRYYTEQHPTVHGWVYDLRNGLLIRPEP